MHKGGYVTSEGVENGSASIKAPHSCTTCRFHFHPGVLAQAMLYTHGKYLLPLRCSLWVVCPDELRGLERGWKEEMMEGRDGRRARWRKNVLYRSTQERYRDWPLLRSYHRAKQQTKGIRNRREADCAKCMMMEELRKMMCMDGLSWCIPIRWLPVGKSNRAIYIDDDIVYLNAFYYIVGQSSHFAGFPHPGAYDPKRMLHSNATGTQLHYTTHRSSSSSSSSAVASSSSLHQDKNIKLTLETKELWQKFHSLGTEMIITKSGRSVSKIH